MARWPAELAQFETFSPAFSQGADDASVPQNTGMKMEVTDPQFFGVT